MRGSELVAQVLRLARESVADPRAGYRRVAGLALGGDTLLLALGAVAAVGVLMGELVLRLIVSRDLHPLLDLGGGPLPAAALQFALAVLLALGIRWIGAAAGGTGSWEGALLAVTWLQLILLLLQVVQLASLLVLPPLAALIGLFGVGLFFWLLTGFIAELHGFTSRLKVFFALLACLFIAGMFALPLLSAFGLALPGLANV